MEIRLSYKQRIIVESKDGPMLVLASAGSGKTRVLTERVRYLLSSQPGTFKVLALTFTNKAADEMQTRLKDVQSIKDRAFIGTIHKFCLELIRSKGTAIGIDKMPHIFERENDRREILLEVFENNLSLKKYVTGASDKDRQKFIFDVLNYISQQKKNLCGLVQTNEAADEETMLLFHEYNAVLSSQNAIDFDDVICLAYKILVERPAVADLYRKMFRYVCIDEAQDLNFAQYELIKALCGKQHNNILMVGDPNQAIYGFNGSSKTFMTENFVIDFNAPIIQLAENFRSSISVLTAAQKLIPNSVDISNAVINGEFSISECQNEQSEAEFITNKIKFFLDSKKHNDIEGDITAERIAVLGRNKYVFKSLEKELGKERIPFVYKKTNDLSEPVSDLLKMYDLGIRILVNSLDKLHFIQLCKLLELEKIPLLDTNVGIDKLYKLSDFIISSDIKNEYTILFESWKVVNSGINNFIKGLELIEAYVNTSPHYSNDLIKKGFVIQDIEELKALWKAYSLQTTAENKTLSNFRNQIALGISLNNNKNTGVILGTVHSVKGLEFDIVFLMGMNEGTFPDYRAVKEGGASLNEEKNNAFVALTRSKRLLYVTYPKQKFMPWDKETPVNQAPSRFLRNLS
ncbi:ATP-dependent helicase [[Flexibacter] sp. ATCC 35208]|uniref:ATP-dependent helicase n=1 Tax=[Flexibacter] sp. ATCC 35208 TaxID=1936242 RepID=UPI0009D49B69|nr:ATP-dependent helicase [[Flexibacter] sp. ATCC 35208]OMP75749.1 hypothetical protein BW716_28350 [[Flexibacter] sp. ATCC 35208]